MSGIGFTDLDGKHDEIRPVVRGTNFGPRIRGDEVLRLYYEHTHEHANGLGSTLPFHIMAAGYGDDDDWVGLDPDELGQFGDDVEALDEQWGPFEVWVEAWQQSYFDEPYDVTDHIDASSPVLALQELRNYLEAEARASGDEDRTLRPEPSRTHFQRWLDALSRAIWSLTVRPD